MQALVAKEKEPITPFLAKIGALRERGVSCILVMGGSGDYFGVSDAVVCMDNYGCRDVTAEALAIDERFGVSAAAQGSGTAYGSVTPRCPVSIYPGSPTGQPCQAPCPRHAYAALHRQAKLQSCLRGVWFRTTLVLPRTGLCSSVQAQGKYTVCLEHGSPAERRA